jgi:hypothetical protein
MTGYVIKGFIEIHIYKHTLEHIQVINLINVIYVVKDIVIVVTYRHTLGCINQPYKCGKGFSMSCSIQTHFKTSLSY